jgi:hypothetical protein
MQKVKVLFSVLLLAAIVTTTMSFSNVSASVDNDQSCTVTVKYKNGSLAKYVKVSTDVSGGVSCIGGRDFTTNDDGVVTLKWAKGCYLKKVYVKGEAYEVDYKDGKSYSLTLTVN